MNIECQNTESVNICHSTYIANTIHSDQRWIRNTSYFQNAKKEKIFKVPSSTCQVRLRKVGCLQNILCLFFKMFIFSLTDSHWRWQCKGCRGENRSFANHAIRAKSFCDQLTKICGKQKCFRVNNATSMQRFPRINWN